MCDFFVGGMVLRVVGKEDGGGERNFVFKIGLPHRIWIFLYLTPQGFFNYFNSTILTLLGM